MSAVFSGRTGALWRRVSNHNVFWRQKIFKFFCKRTNKIQCSTMQPLKTLKPFELTWPLRKQPSNSRMLLVRLQKKKLDSFVFQKPLWLDNRELKQRRFWAKHVNRKRAFFSSNKPWRYCICIAKWLNSCSDDLPKNLFKITAQECKVHFRLTCVAQKTSLLKLPILHPSAPVRVVAL